MLENLTPFADAVRNAGVRYFDAYAAWQKHEFAATRVSVGRRCAKYLTPAQAEAFKTWAESFRQTKSEGHDEAAPLEESTGWPTLD